DCSLQDLSYSYDGFGNLASQAEGVTGASETYGYDDLQRLIWAERSDVPNLSQPRVDYGYDALGNFQSKSDYATGYSYGQNGAGPNAVTAVTKVPEAGGGTAAFTYDGNGNLKTGDGLDITYDAFNLPVDITRNGAETRFDYGPDHQRYRQIAGATTTTYVGKLYEKTNTEERAYLSGYAIKDSQGIHYTHRDRLGSPSLITDGSGNIEQRRGFGPFGKARDANWGETLAGQLLSAVSPRGFTDHEHLDSVALIHMNGRAYDYNLGRFLSVDPVIQFPENGQSLNPYSYLMNNPLLGIDPSGLKACDIGDLDKCGIKNGETVTITKHGHEVGEVSLSKNGQKTSVAGSLKGANAILAAGGTDARLSRNGRVLHSTPMPSSASSDRGDIESINTPAKRPSIDQTKDAFGTSAVGSSTSVADGNGPTFWGFVQEDGWDVVSRTLQVVGGTGQAALGASMCVSVVGCVGGAAIAIKGVDNVQAGFRGDDSFTRQALIAATGSRRAGSIIDAGLDLATSLAGTLRPIPKLGPLGNPRRSFFVRDPSFFEPAINQATDFSLFALGVESGATLVGSTILDPTNKPADDH
ncbi:MAG: RHS repeat-associated core domain-containing protein, partial [Candidatus Promineifilaceae bacterium]